MIYFDSNKQAYGFEIPNYIATTTEETWVNYAGTDKWDIIDGEFTDITNTPSYLNQKIEKLKAEKFQENLAKCYAYLDKSYITYANAQFETNTDANTRLQSALVLIQSGAIQNVNWVSKDDKQLILTANDIIAIMGLGATFVANVWNTKYLGFKTQIENATTINAIESVIINYDESNL